MFLSCKFKIHNPSGRKREILDNALSEYTYAMKYLLDWSQENLEVIKENGKYVSKTGKEKYTDKSIAQILPKPSELQARIASCNKEALVSNVAAMLASYLQLDEGDKQEAGFPVCRDPAPEAYPNALEDFCTVGADLEAENDARYRMMRVIKSQVMPLHFSRSRDFALLFQPEKEQFFLWGKLIPQGDENAQKLIITDLVNCSTGEPFSYNGKSAVLFPLELGDKTNGWQWRKFIVPLLEGEAFAKASKLAKEGDDYFIHVSFDMPEPEQYEPETYLGVNRGIIHTIGYGVVDMDGNIIETGHSEDPFLFLKERAMKRVQARQKRFAKINKRDYKRQELDNVIHSVVNQVLGTAKRNRAVIVLEDWKLDNVSAFYRSCYQKVSDIIEYKAKAAGVPILKRTVFGAYASQICIHCGRELDRDGRIVTCLTCGKQEHVDETNGVNIARRALYKKEEWGGTKDKPGNWREFHCSFANGRDFRAKVDLRIPA